jgi:hypothetical protein
MDGPFLYASETGFWSERRRAARRVDSLTQSPPTSGPLDALFQSMPSLGKAPLTSSLSEAAMKSVPKDFLDRHKDILAALPFHYGDIRHIALPQGAVKGVVVNIHDIHMNLEAQRNMAGAVESLMTKGQAGLLALEGAFGDTRVELYRTFPDKEALRMAADCLLREDEITGPVFAALTHDGVIPPVVGVDDKARYDANVAAYVQAAPARGRAKAEIASRQWTLADQKATIFNPELKNLDALVEGHRNGRVALGDYLKGLRDAVPDRVPATGRQFLETLEAEEALDFTEVENQRTRLLTKLPDALTDTQERELIRDSLAYRAGQMRYADFYRRLKEVTARAGVPLAEYPAMDAYVRYVIRADGIDAAQLFKDMDGWEQAAYDRRARTEEEKTLARKSKFLALANKLADFSLTREEWEAYAALKVDTSRALSAFEGFYTEARARDDALARNLLKAMDADKTRSAVLVTGGFHAEGIAEKLNARGYAVIAYTPKITRVDTENGSAYLSVFTREKTPLEKLFAGEKLFLSRETAVNGTAAAPRLAAAATLLGMAPGDLLSEIKRLLKNENINVEDIRVHAGEALLTVTIGAKGGTVETDFKVRDDGGKQGLETFAERASTTGTVREKWFSSRRGMWGAGMVPVLIGLALMVGVARHSVAGSAGWIEAAIKSYALAVMDPLLYFALVVGVSVAVSGAMGWLFFRVHKKYGLGRPEDARHVPETGPVMSALIAVGAAAAAVWVSLTHPMFVIALTGAISIAWYFLREEGGASPRKIKSGGFGVHAAVTALIVAVVTSFVRAVERGKGWGEFLLFLVVRGLPRIAGVVGIVAVVAMAAASWRIATVVFRFIRSPATFGNANGDHPEALARFLEDNLARDHPPEEGRAKLPAVFPALEKAGIQEIAPMIWEMVARNRHAVRAEMIRLRSAGTRLPSPGLALDWARTRFGTLGAKGLSDHHVAGHIGILAFREDLSSLQEFVAAAIAVNDAGSGFSGNETPSSLRQVHSLPADMFRDEDVALWAKTINAERTDIRIIERPTINVTAEDLATAYGRLAGLDGETSDLGLTLFAISEVSLPSLQAVVAMRGVSNGVKDKLMTALLSSVHTLAEVMGHLALVKFFFDTHA